MKLCVKKMFCLAVISLLMATLFVLNAEAAETYVEAQMFDDIPDIKEVTEGYDLKLIDRGNGNNALLVTPLKWVEKALTIELCVARKDYSGANYFEFYIGTSDGEGEFGIAPALHDSQGWIGMNSAEAVLFSDGLVGTYYLKPDGGKWEIREQGDNITIPKGFCGYVRLPIECITHDNIKGETNVPVKLDELLTVANWYSYFNAGEKFILDDFRFVYGDNSFYEPDAESNSQQTDLNQNTDDESYDLDALFEVKEENSSKTEVSENDSVDNSNISVLLIIIISTVLSAAIIAIVIIVWRKSKK